MTHRTVRAVAVGVACSGLVAALLAPSIANAQAGPPKARDGRSLADESQAVQAQFQAAYGNGAGTQWQRLHNLTLRSDLPQAADGQSIRSAPADTQTAFIAIYGGDGPANWAIVHSGAIGKAIILTGDLEESVDAAHDGDLNVARREFKQFTDAWENGFEPLIRPRSGDIADAVANQIRAVSAVLVTPQNPDKAKYSAALDELLDIANAQKVKLAALPGRGAACPRAAGGQCRPSGGGCRRRTAPGDQHRHWRAGVVDHRRTAKRHHTRARRAG